ncbi:MAG: bifunctional UDP-N-acetylglucosamine diphosphorylase/glucosamine-1-phosphate N-acetyltransferase GlmU [Candidatus Caenarcaniphilales bacterium]|nr:bifunctional UDP-N-acetylglucosamine diphosphorylase/glucosamine-1-phosphate N-acetyltransferase GlmU [Candidatus Caenarcaniphilales bacterium]
MKIIVLAAGKSTRFKSKKHKALHQIFGKSILERVLETLWELNPKQIQFVLGHQLEEVASNLKNGETYVHQLEQLGTGHALKYGLSNLEDDNDGLLVTCVDTPLLKKNTLNGLINVTKSQEAQVGILSAKLENPFGYGRIVKKENYITKIVEEKDATEEEKRIDEINSGVYYFNMPYSKLLEGISSIKNSNKQQEYYLTDIIEWANSEKLKSVSYVTDDPSETFGINSKADFANAINILNQRKIKDLQNNGVIFINPSSCFVSPETFIGADTVVYPNTYFNKKVNVGENCQIGPNSFIEDSTIEGNSVVRFSQVVETNIGKDCSVGPFANLRPGTKMLDYSSVGDFVEVKNSEIGSRTRVPHLSYIGDSCLGNDVNIGAGTITANYNAITDKKSRTKLGDNVKVGSNSVLVSPVEVSDGCMIGAGSIVTESVNCKDSLVISRNKQEVKENWVKDKKSQLESEV